MAAADVRDPGAGRELVEHAVERRQPGVHQVRQIAGPEKSLSAGEQVVMVLVPAKALARAEALGYLRLVLDGGRHQLKGARDERGAVFVGQGHRLLGWQPEGPRGRVVLDVAAGRLLAQPLADVALVTVGALGQLLGGDRLAVGHRLVQAELVADQNQRRGDRRAQVAHELTHELFELCFIYFYCAHRASSDWLIGGMSCCCSRSCASPAS